MNIRIFAFAIALFGGAAASAQDAWDVEFYDPAKGRGIGPDADFLLPLPCGGQMAFQKVAIPMDASDPLADTEVRLGQTGSLSGYLDYLYRTHIRGGFNEADGKASYYYVARYELNNAQYKALTQSDDCAFDIKRPDVLAKGGLSWFDGVGLSQTYTEWLRENAANILPVEDGQSAYIRLPTETEWEFAARGGAAVEQAADFGSPRFPMTGEVDAYARFDAERVGPVGLKQPNPLGLFDVYGNLEELMLEPFRLNAIGHQHGQVGGIITRGGSFRSSRDQMRSANRKEWPLYSRTGRAQAQDSFGVRFVLTVHVNTSDTRIRMIRERWNEKFESGAGEVFKPSEALAELIDRELDPVRRSALEDVLLALTSADEAVARAAERQIETTLQGAALFLTAIWDDSRLIGDLEELVQLTIELIEVLEDPDEITFRENQVAQHRNSIQQRSIRLDLSSRGYRDALDFLITSAEAEDIDRIAAIVDRRFAEADNGYLASALKAARDDLIVLRPRPDMERDKFLLLAIDR